MSRDALSEWGERPTLQENIELVERFFQMYLLPENDHLFYWKSGNLPKIQVPVLYMVVGNMIRWKFVVVEYYTAPEEGIRLWKGNGNDGNEGKVMHGKFIVITGPFQVAEEDLPMKGFQGFRYGGIKF